MTEPIIGDGIPQDGDRSAKDATNYPELHANDIDTTDGIHHTIGTGEGQVSPGDHTHENDHNPVTISDTDTIGLTLIDQLLSADVKPNGIKLDDLGSPDDNTDLDASVSKHGLAPKGISGTTKFWRQDWTLMEIQVFRYEIFQDSDGAILQDNNKNILYVEVP